MDPQKELPPGATAQDVADNVDAKLSEGEYVIPANVVRFLGLDKIEKMVQQAQEKLAELEDQGRIGGEEILSEDDVELPFAEEELVGFAAGGLVDTPDSNVAANTLPQDNGFSGTRTFKNKDGQVMYIPFFNGKPMFTIPPDYSPTATEAVTSKAPDPNETLPTYQNQSRGTPLVSKGEGKDSGPKMAPSPLAGDPEDWSVQDFINYGKQATGPEKKVFQGLVSLMPGGKLAFKARDKYLSKKTGELFDQMLDTNKDLQGKELTPEMRQDLITTKNKLAGDLSQEAGVQIDPAEKIGNMIDRFTSFVTGKPQSPSSTSMAPRSSMNSSASQMLNNYSNVGDTFRPSNNNSSDNQTGGFSSNVPKTEAERKSTNAQPDRYSSGGLYGKGGLVKRRK